MTKPRTPKIQKNKVYYLDTSAIRSLGKKIKEISMSLQCTTSFLTVMELISGIDTSSSKDFDRRKSALINLRDSKVKIKWVFHEQAVCRAFGVNQEKMYSDFASKLRKIQKFIFSSDNFEGFLSNLRKNNLEKDYKLIISWDNHISRQYSETNWSSVRNSLGKDQNFEVFSEIEVESMLKLGKSLLERHRDLNYSMSKWALASSVTGHPEPEEAYNNYDFSIEIHIQSLAIQGAKDIANQRNPGKNDGSDLYHLVYLREGDTLISNDKLHLECINDLKNYGFDINANTTDYLT
jgi:hypothetical protein